MDDFNGVVFINHNLGIWITTVGGYKKPCLFVFEPPNSWIKVASFTSEEAVTLFKTTLAKMMKLMEVL